jgi:ubiquinone biosynthesis protein COQ9
MAPKKAKNNRENIVYAALKLAPEKGWANVTLRDIAAEAGMSLADLRELCEDKSDIFGMLARIVDGRVIESVGDIDESMGIRDRIFDVMMERFEILNDYREGVTAILNSFFPDPKQALITFPMTCRSMVWMLEAAKVDTGGLSGALKVAGLTGVYIKVLKDWKDDFSPDLSKTMAALDRALGHAEQAAELLKV